METPSNLNRFREKAAAVQVVISEIPDLAAAFAYAINLTIKPGGEVMAACGWDV